MEWEGFFDTPASHCGGNCDGAGRCRAFAKINAPCSAGSCNGGKAQGSFCDGLGTCRFSDTGLDCAPYACSNATGACLGSCTTTADCDNRGAAVL